jgi:hypothetical protein
MIEHHICTVEFFSNSTNINLVENYFEIYDNIKNNYEIEE